MRKIGFGAPAIALLLCFTSFAVPRPQDAANSDSTEAAQLANAYVDAYNSHEPHAVAALFTEDADFIRPNGQSLHTRQAIERFFQPIGAGGSLSASHRTLSLKTARTVSPGIVAVYFDSDEIRPNAADGKVNQPNTVSFVFVVVKRDSHWEIAVSDESYPAK